VVHAAAIVRSWAKPSRATVRHLVPGGGCSLSRASIAGTTRLRDCVAAITGIDGRPIEDILGRPDDLKFCSCLTLFSAVAEDPALFDRALDKFYGGHADPLTLRLLSHQNAAVSGDNPL
jgi:Protein of unknown function (DUF1810)